jgi:hypothetical protein
VGQAPAFQRTLQQPHPLLLLWEVFECHPASYNSTAQRREAVISLSPVIGSSTFRLAIHGGPGIVLSII